PGASIGTLTLNLLNTSGKLTMQSGSGFQFELGAPGGSIGAPGTSDLLQILNAAPGDLAFNNNVIDFLGTATGAGFYKLLDTDLIDPTGTTWTGLTYGSP